MPNIVTISLVKCLSVLPEVCLAGLVQLIGPYQRQALSSDNAMASRCRQEALESAISEKDVHLALLEVSGLRTAKQAEEADKLRADRRRLMDRLKQVVSSVADTDTYRQRQPLLLSKTLINLRASIHIKLS